MSKIPVYYDRVKQGSTATGAGAITLGSAITGFRAFSVVGNGNGCVICIEAVDGNGVPTGEWEICESIYSSSGPSLSRGNLRSSSTGSRVSLSSGAKYVSLILDSAEIFPKSYNAKAFGCVGNGSTDDTAALQAIIDMLGAAGGGTIYFPPGIYVIGGALQDTSNSNCQLKLPTVGLDVATVSITFKGPLTPPTQFFTWTNDLPVAGYAVLKSTLTGASGTASILSGHYTSALDPNQNNVAVHFEDMIIELPSNPTVSGPNLKFQQAGHHKNLLIHCGTVNLQNVAQPTYTNQYGILLCDYSHAPHQRLENVIVFGCYWGMRLGELTTGIGVRFWACYNALEVPFQFHPSIFLDLGIYWGPYGIVATGGGFGNISNLRVLLLDNEHANGNGASWQNIVYDINDASNYLYGDLVYQTVKSGVGKDSEFLKNGGLHFNCSEIGT